LGGHLLTLFSFKKQVMVGIATYPVLSGRVCVKVPTLLLPFFDGFANILTVSDFDAIPFFQPNHTSFT
jgi:hypothetical protein